MPAKGVGRGYNNRRVFFSSPRRVRSIGEDRGGFWLIPRRDDVSKFFAKAGKFSLDFLYFHPRHWRSLFFFLSCPLPIAFLLRSSATPLYPGPLSSFAFNRIILTRLCFIRAARSVCSGITSTQGKNKRKKTSNETRLETRIRNGIRRNSRNRE